MKRCLLLLASSVFGIISGCECGDPDGRDTFYVHSDYTAWVPDSDDSPDWDDDGWTVNEGDCDDSDPTIHPYADEICDDELDNDCDQLTDSDDTEDCDG